MRNILIRVSCSSGMEVHPSFRPIFSALHWLVPLFGFPLVAITCLTASTLIIFGGQIEAQAGLVCQLATLEGSAGSEATSILCIMKLSRSSVDLIHKAVLRQSFLSTGLDG
ncbi:hypothetical protein BDV23DRAFT_135486 [Aspergillus alliaceus]|uniref:Uncharacterized protein n=1 Tax=Petromyces alliaceus TaxID=209559 RepID=A0A5N7CKM0_PETAA|nr:hypothetical protein BDV23DRAFT_135486 [Aspergillus alliaceus]